MDSNSLPNDNYVGLLQSICARRKIDLPKYEDVESDRIQYFSCICHLGELTTEGSSNSKKVAKQIAARDMIEKIKDKTDLTPGKKNTNDSAVSKLLQYCSKNKKPMPLFGDLPQEGTIFSRSCQFEGFTGIGKGHNKKVAKEEAALSVVKHFEIDKYFENIQKLENRKDIQKNSVTLLHEFCQAKKLDINFMEESLKEGAKIETYLVTCSVGDLKVSSSQNSSKKIAKLDAASLMLALLNNNTPKASPDVIAQTKRNVDTEECPIKRMKSVD